MLAQRDCLHFSGFPTCPYQTSFFIFPHHSKNHPIAHFTKMTLPGIEPGTFDFVYNGKCADQKAGQKVRRQGGGGSFNICQKKKEAWQYFSVFWLRLFLLPFAFSFGVFCVVGAGRSFLPVGACLPFAPRLKTRLAVMLRCAVSCCPPKNKSSSIWSFRSHPSSALLLVYT